MIWFIFLEVHTAVCKLETERPVRKLFQSLFHGGWINVESMGMEMDAF